nr:hypothetical protein [uncultured Acetatifactor sp.]
MERERFGEGCWCEDDLISGQEDDGMELIDGPAGQPCRICRPHAPSVHQAGQMQIDGCMERAGPLEDLARTMVLRAEYNYLLCFAEDNCFHDCYLQDQLRAIWTAFCFHAGWEADTEPYDNTMMELWDRIGEKQGGWPDFGSFDDYMCGLLA